MSPARVVFVCVDIVGELMAGPAIRSVELAAVVSAAGHDVILAAPVGSTLDRAGVTLREWGDNDALRSALADAEVLVVFAPVLADNLWMASLGVPLVVDAYDPGLLETLEQRRGDPFNAQRTWVEDASRHLVDPLSVADVVLVANDRQRHLVIGMLAASGRVGSRISAEDPALEEFIRCVPFGLPAAPPDARSHPLRVPQGPLAADAFIAYWGGGLYSWLDPITLLEAVALSSDQRVSAALLAGPHPTPVVGELPLADVARRRADELGLLPERVSFVEHWVPYRERGDWLRDADVGVSLHHRHIETELSFRTRVLDYLWAGLPVVCTEGDVLATLVADRGLGFVVPPDDPAAVAQALSVLAGEDPGSAAQRRARIAAVAAEMTWEQVARPLVEFCARPKLAPDRRVRTDSGEGVSQRLRRAMRIARGRG